VVSSTDTDYLGTLLIRTWDLTDIPLFILTADYPGHALPQGNVLVTIDGLEKCPEAYYVPGAYGPIYAESELHLIDEYANTTDPSTMSQYEWAKMLGPRGDSQLFVLSWTLSQGAWEAISCSQTVMDLGEHAAGAFPDLFLNPYLAGISGGSPTRDAYRSRKPNILYFDVADEEVTGWAQAINAALYPPN
jgi:hypothetical protein